MVKELKAGLDRYWKIGALIGGAIAAGLGAGVALPSAETARRLTSLEERVEVLERVGRYQGCRAWMADRGKSPADCSIIYKDLEDYLIDPERLP